MRKDPRGGKRPNSGRKTPPKYTESIAIKTTPEQKEKYNKLGPEWVRKKIDEEPV